MVDSLCILIRIPPYGTIQAAEALRHLGGTVIAKLKVMAVFIDDGVYVVKAGQRVGDTGWTSLSDTVRKVASLSQMVADMGKATPHLYVHGPSLAARGLTAADLVPGLEVVDDKGWASLMTEADAVMVY